MRKILNYFSPILMSLICSLFSININAQVNAQKTQSVSTSAPVQKEVVEEKLFNLGLDISKGESLVDQNDGNKSESLDLVLKSSYSFPIGVIYSELGYSQNLKDSEDPTAGISDLSIKYIIPSLPFIKNKFLSLNWGNSLSTVVPLSEVSTKKNQLRSSLALGTGLNLASSDQSQILGGDWSIDTTLSVGRIFHDFEEDINGQILNKYSSNQGISLSYSHTGFGLSLSFLNRSRWTYQNNIRQSFVASQELSYQINDHFSISTGHSNEASSLKVDGETSNISLIDDQTSTVYATISISL